VTPTRLLALLLLAATLVACGKIGPPEPPPGVQNTFPKAYPSAN
jgi:predicted small lipoprotein YifL